MKLFEYDKNHNCSIIGTDEAGRGSGIGAVFAGAVYFPPENKNLSKKLTLLNDSKQLSKKRGEELYEIIKSETINCVTPISAEEIEEINILNASLKAMRISVETVAKQVNRSDILVLVDGNKLIPNIAIKQKYVVKGDGISASIAAASILAKVERDRYVEQLAQEFPQYAWDKNMGYLTKEHLDAIDKYGTSPFHRKSFLQKHFAKQEQLSLF
ncbi:ribonuclease HII [bacterium]|nr:ribonuclease HII [bacterium]